MHELADQFVSYVRAAWRYRWYAVVVAWIIALGGWIAVYLAPDRYEASARVHVDTETVLRPLLAGLAVQPNIDQLVMMMSRTLISRPNVDKLIRMAGLDVNVKTAEERTRLITRLTKEMAIKSAGRDQYIDNIYTISCFDEDPQVAKRTVQGLLTLFVESSVGGKREDSAAARHFIDEELKSSREKLQAAEDAMMDFKRQHQGLMSGDARDYYGRLAAAKMTLDEAALALQEAENSRDVIRKQLAGDAETASLPGDRSAAPGDRSAGGEVNSEIDVRIRALQVKLDNLRLNYTEQHPDIIATLRSISQLREQKEAEAKLKTALPSAAKAKGPVNQPLTVSLATAEANVAAMKVRVAEYSRRYNALQAVANAVPQVEAQYTELTRDYGVNKARYDELLKRSEQAQITRDMEANDAVMGFRVIDPPHVPDAPSAPNRPLLMTADLLAALGGGVGVALLISLIRPTINDERRLRELSGLPVLGAVSMTLTDGQKARRTRGLVGFLMSFAGLLSAYAAIMAELVLTGARI